MRDLISHIFVELSAIPANLLGKQVPLVEIPNRGYANALESLTRLGAMCVLLRRRRYGVALQRVVERGKR